MRNRLARAMEASLRFTIPQLAETTGATYESAGRLVWELKKSGAVRCEQPKRNGHRGGVAVYVLEGKGAAPKRSGRYPAWRSMRMFRRFQIKALIATAGIGENNAIKFVLGLERAGYLFCDLPCRSGIGMGGAVYALIRDTGPLPPRVNPDGSVVDFNLKAPNKAGSKCQRI
jgi:hypothetical protein